MSYIEQPALYELKDRQPISASGVNANFRTVVELIGTAVMTVRTPGAIINGLEVKVADLEQRTKILENLSAMHARQRNEPQYAPLSSLGAVLMRVDALQRSVEDAVVRLEKALAAAESLSANQHARLAALEARPAMASRHEVLDLAQLHDQTVQIATNAMRQAMSLRREVMELRGKP